MSAIAFPVLVFALLLCVPLAGRMAVRRDRSAKLWMWLAAFLGPLPLAVLALIPKARD
jgi:NO-binding membrane sensor protein with MHYT domain